MDEESLYIVDNGNPIEKREINKIMDDNEFISEVIQDCLEDNESEAFFQVEAAQDFDSVEVTIYIQ